MDILISFAITLFICAVLFFVGYGIYLTITNRWFIFSNIDTTQYQKEYIYWLKGDLIWIEVKYNDYFDDIKTNIISCNLIACNKSEIVLKEKESSLSNNELFSIPFSLEKISKLTNIPESDIRNIRLINKSCTQRIENDKINNIVESFESINNMK